MLKIRLRRMGSRHRPFYRLVVSDSRQVPTASAIDEIGYYDPRRQPAVLNIDLAKADTWLAKGVQPSDTAGKLIQQARKKGNSPLPAAIVPKRPFSGKPTPAPVAAPAAPAPPAPPAPAPVAEAAPMVEAPPAAEGEASA
jgi:small subunit ribosomal protein S16